MFKIITCINKKGVIGNEGKLLYHIKNDLANFKRMTVGNVVIMGRKTFESLPGGKPLNDRINIVLTHDAEWGTRSMSKSCRIKYCPFCGEKLKDYNNINIDK